MRYPTPDHEGHYWAKFIHTSPNDWKEDERLPCYTSSIDAALALVKRLLPGWSYQIMRAQRGADGFYFIARVSNVVNDDVIGFDAVHDAAAPLAILSALLAALNAGRDDG